MRSKDRIGLCGDGLVENYLKMSQAAFFARDSVTGPEAVSPLVEHLRGVA